MPRQSLRFALGFAALLLWSATVWAGSQGRISGVVLDADGQAVADATVTITGLDRDTEDTYTTNKKGKFRAVVVDASLKHTIRIEAEGFQTLEKPLDIGIGSNNLRYTLQAGSGGDAGTPTLQGGRGGPSKEVAAIFNAGAEAANVGDLTTARMKFEEALALDPELTVAHSALAGIYFEGGEHDKALAAVEKGLSESPDSSRLLTIAYESNLALGNDDRASEILEQLKATGGGRDVSISVFNQGAEAAQVGDLTTAIAKFSLALELNPELVNAFGGLAMSHLANHDYQEAADWAEKWLEAQPGMVKAMQVKYDAYRLLGDEEKTQMAFDDFAAANPVMFAKNLHDQANAAFNANQIDQAIQIAESILSFKPDHPRAHYIMGLCMVNKGNMAEAKQHLQEFATLAPDDPDAAGAAEMAKSL